MQDGMVSAKGKALESMSEGVPQIKRLAQSFLGGILRHNPFFRLYTPAHQVGEALQVGLHQVELQVLRPHIHIGEQRVLQHLGIARPQVGIVQST